MNTQTVEAVIDHIKTALGPVPWADREFCEECDFVLEEGEEGYCPDCDISG